MIGECPASFIDPTSAELVASIQLASNVREATGEHPLPPVNMWPVRLIDIARIVHTEGIKQNNSCFKAEQSERER